MFILVNSSRSPATIDSREVANGDHVREQGLKSQGRHSQSGMDFSDMYVAGPVWALFTCDDSRRSGIYAINQLSLSASLQLIKSSLRTTC